MSVGRNTFVFSMLKRVGIPMIELEDNYPQVDLEKFDRKSTLLLCSSEPFPFLKHRQDLVKESFPFALVNGESFTWFGLRALRFLQLTNA